MSSSDILRFELETPFGKGELLVYNRTSARFCAGHGSNEQPMLINSVEYRVDFDMCFRGGIWRVGDVAPNGQLVNWHPEIRRVHWEKANDRYASNSAIKKVNEVLVPVVVHFLSTLGDTLVHAERRDIQRKLDRLNADIHTAQEKLAELGRQRQELLEQMWSTLRAISEASVSS